MSFIRDEINRVCAEADKVMEEIRAAERKREQLVQKKADGLIYKTRDNALVEPAAAPQPTVPMSAAEQAPWDQWLDARIEAALDLVWEICGSELGRAERRLSDEVASLRAELAIERAARTNKDVA